MHLRAAVLALSLWGGTITPAAADVVSSSETSFVSRSEITVAAPPAGVWSALLAPAKWWDPAHTWSGNAANLYLDPQATGCFCELLPVDPVAAPGTPRGSVEHLHVIHVAPGKLLRLRGGLGPLQAEPVVGVLTISLTPAGDGTRVVFDYRVSGLVTMKGSEMAGPVDDVLAAQLGRLADWSARPVAATAE